MRILVKSEDHNVCLRFPTNLIFSPLVANIAKFGLRYAPDDVPSISPEAMEALFAEFRRIKKKYGHWELVDMETASGTEVVKITL